MKKRIFVILGLLSLVGCQTTNPNSSKAVATATPDPILVEDFDPAVYAKKNNAVLGEFPSPTGIKLPEPIRREIPIFPSKIMGYVKSGSTNSAILIDEQGNVIEVVVFEATHPAFRKSAEKSLSKWIFSPGLVDGVAKPFVIIQPLNYYSK